ncbi:MAG TPA: class I SAM-dependent methyltransferase [Phycisphaerales bacterium]|nr:class I SAM-dependent methyltransferase [Phycisphaerales bacterium]
MERVKRYYDSNPEMEWQRLQHDVYARIEYEVTLHFIHKYLVPGNRCIDIGGGPGRYTIHLLQQAYHVTLLDLSPMLLQKAQQQIEQQELTAYLDGIHERNAVDLSGIESDSYDLTLLLGPLYHLTKEYERIQAIEQAYRVTKPGGYIFSAIIPRLSVIRDIFRWSPNAAQEYLAGHEEQINQLIETGVYLNLKEDPAQFTDAYFANTEDIPSLYQQQGIELIEAFSCEGIAAFLNDRINQLVNNEHTWKILLDLIIKTSTTPSILGAGEHCVFIGQKA